MQQIEKTVYGENSTFSVKLCPDFYANSDDYDHAVSFTDVIAEKTRNVIIDLLISNDELLQFFEAVSDNDFFASYIIKQDQNVYLKYDVFNSVEKISEQGIPRSLAFVFAILTDGDYTAFEDMLDTGASIQVDNMSRETSLEIFGIIYKESGIEMAKKIFRIFGGSIQEQKRFLDTIIKLSENSVDKLIRTDEEFFLPILNMLSIPYLSENEIMVLHELVNYFDKKDWIKTGEIVSFLKDQDVQSINVLLDTKYSQAEMLSLLKVAKGAPLYANESSRLLKNINISEEDNSIKIISALLYKFGIKEILDSYESVRKFCQESSSNDYLFNNFSITQLIPIVMQNEYQMEFSLSMSIAGFSYEPSEWI